MRRSWRTIGHKLMHLGRRAGPVLLSVGLVTWSIWKVTPQRLAQAADSGVLPGLVLATLVQLVVLFVWDTISVWWLFCQPNQPIPFRTALRARTDSVLWSAVNLEVGQAMFAWTLAAVRKTSITDALARCAVLGLFDFGTTQAVALVGSLLYHDPVIDVLRWIPIVSVSGLVVLAALLYFLPRSWRQWLEGKNWGSWLAWWTWRHSIVLGAQRLVLFLLVLVYAGVCLAICGLPVDVGSVGGIMPFVILAQSLPGTGGLGERETALVYLLRPSDPDQRAMLLCFGLTWSLVVNLGRIVIGLVSRWLPRHQPHPSNTQGVPHE